MGPRGVRLFFAGTQPDRPGPLDRASALQAFVELDEFGMGPDQRHRGAGRSAWEEMLRGHCRGVPYLLRNEAATTAHVLHGAQHGLGLDFTAPRGLLGGP